MEYTAFAVVKTRMFDPKKLYATVEHLRNDQLDRYLAARTDAKSFFNSEVEQGMEDVMRKLNDRAEELLIDKITRKDA